MPKTYYFSTRLGKSKNKGDNPFEPLRDADDFDKLLLEPGDSVLFHADETYEGNFDLRRSGAEGKPITIGTYLVGGERTRWASFQADATATRPISWNINASYIHLRHLQATKARYAGFVFRERQAHHTGENLRMRECGIGVRLRGSQTTLTHADVQDGVFSRAQNLVTDEGGVAFSVEADGWVNEGNSISMPFVQNAVAVSDDKIDGGVVEVFGDIVGLTVDGGVFIFGKGGIEIGGPTRQPGETPALARDITFKGNVFINCGLWVQLNDPAKAFPIRLKNIRFIDNTFYDRTRALSAVWIQGNWPNIAEALSFEGNIYDGLGTFIGTNGTTNLNAIPRTENVYHRDGNKVNMGYTIEADEYVGDPLFADAEAFDFRLTQRFGVMAYRPGALEMAQSFASTQDLKWLLKQTRIPFTANDIAGGLHTGAYHRDMWGTPQALRRAGMEFAVTAFDQCWRLDADKKTWLRMGA